MNRDSKPSDSPKLHGNNAKICPTKSVQSLYQSNMATMAGQKKGKAPVVNQVNVDQTRDFSIENKK